MKVLFIVRSFAPDSGIATIRPTQMAKHLSALGHEVIVIRSGLIFGRAEKKNLNGLEKISIYSYEGEDSPAEQFEKDGSIPQPINRLEEQHSDGLKVIKKLAHIVLDPFLYYFNSGLRIKRKVLAEYRKNIQFQGVDVVISSFSPLGCILAGKTIHRMEKCKWIVDYRDLMDNCTYPWIIRKVNSFLQRQFVKNADASLCVSEGNSLALKEKNKRKYESKVHVIYNGYESDESIERENHCINEKIHICYTGTLYGGDRDCSPLFHALNKLVDKKQPQVVIDYAGRDGAILKQQASRYGMEGIIIDHGYLSRTDTMQLQSESDLFLVISWNTKKDQGILTGKFYEALQHKKPIIALVSGEVPNSELKLLIEKYRLGVCYEEANGSFSMQSLTAFLEEQFARRQKGESLLYTPDETVFSKFEYSGIVKELEKIMLEVIEA